MARIIADGEDCFEKVILKDLFYIDKTEMIYDWEKSNKKVCLITRPRRFGKSFNLNMMNTFYSNKYAGRGEELFGRLKVWKHEDIRSIQGSYPVIFLSFAGVKQNNYRLAEGQIRSIIARTYREFYYLLQSDKLSEKEKQYFENVSAGDGTEDLSMTLNILSEYLMKHYGKKTIILMDEYDTPMQEAYVSGFWDEMVNLIRNLFNNSFKSNPYMDRAILTGITRVSKESIFSDMNNLTICSMTEKLFSEYYGFTEAEVIEALKEFNISDTFDKVKEWYDGFKIGEISDIYNPWSIIKYLDTKKFKPYWANSSSNALVSKLLKIGDKVIKTDFERLMNGDVISVKLDEEIVFSRIENSNDAVWSLLTASGYLKIKEYSEKKSAVEITNYETYRMFENLINDWFGGVQSDYNDFVRALLRDDIYEMNAYINRISEKIFSYFDVGGSDAGRMEPERFYHGFVLGLMVDLEDRYVLLSNRESGFDRYDVMLIPKDASKDRGIILEFKVFDDRKEKTPEDSVKRALQQIEDKEYKTELLAKGVAEDNIFCYGFAFKGKEVLIGKDDSEAVI